jgi:hypothetical protein
MKNRAMVVIAALAATSMVNPALAQHVTPPNTTAVLVGNALLVKDGPPTSTLNCTLTMQITTGPDLVTPPHAGHAATATLDWATNSGAPGCSVLTVDPTDISFHSYGAGDYGYGGMIGVLDDLVVRLGGGAICDWNSSDGPLEFKINNIDPSGPGVEVIFGAAGTADISPDCHIDAILYDDPATLRVEP